MAEYTRRDWFARMLDAGTDLGVLGADAILDQAPPAVLVENLTSEQVASLLESGLAADSMTPQLVVDTVSIPTLGERLPESAIWAAIAGAALTSGLIDDAPVNGDVQTFLSQAVKSGIETDQLSSDALLQHATPSVLAANLPTELAASLLQASLEAGSMSPDLIIETLGVDALAEHLPAKALWACVCEVAGSPGPGDVEGETATFKLAAGQELSDLDDPQQSEEVPMLEEMIAASPDEQALEEEASDEEAAEEASDDDDDDSSDDDEGEPAEASDEPAEEDGLKADELLDFEENPDDEKTVVGNIRKRHDYKGTPGMAPGRMRSGLMGRRWQRGSGSSS